MSKARSERGPLSITVGITAWTSGCISPDVYIIQFPPGPLAPSPLTPRQARLMLTSRQARLTLTHRVRVALPRLLQTRLSLTHRQSLLTTHPRSHLGRPEQRTC